MQCKAQTAAIAGFYREDLQRCSAPISASTNFNWLCSLTYDPLNGLTSLYPGFFNSIDILNRTRELQFLAFETLIEVLDSFGIDTSDLKQQKGNILSINVSGGQTSFGSVVQGEMNRVSSMIGGAKS